ncbi:MAG: methyltransferase domain-containing protein [Verrucomicrobiales bacterium]|nr:methyltransferase domain-containing protein [Verrucomicrobiales bacterium]MCP5527275.1 methyltransferase domain-containing protein [Verrucomicrobiales bacterium]
MNCDWSSTRGARGANRRSGPAGRLFFPRPGGRRQGWTCLWFGLVAAVGWPAATGAEPDAAPAVPAYEFRAEHSPDGIGKFFLGREIAHVMGHPGAWWLERAERETEEEPARLVGALGLKPGQAVADLGSGTGYFTRRLAQAVGPSGRVYAVDIQPEMLELLQENLRAEGIGNVVSVLATESDPRLPENSLDLLLLVDVYHELSHPKEVMAQVMRALKPAGRVAFVEYRAEDPEVPIKPLHKMSEAQVRKEAEAHGLEWIETIRTLPRQHLVLCRKPAPPSPSED